MSDDSDIVSIINTYTFLEKQGNVYKGFCPFCNSQEERFIVRPDLNEWHCFECGAGGDADDFVALYEGTILHRTPGQGNAETPTAQTESPVSEEEQEIAALSDSEEVFKRYFDTLRKISGYTAAAIIDGNLQLLAADTTDGTDAVQLTQLNQVFMDIIDEAHKVFGEDLTAMESEITIGSDEGILLYSALQFRDEPVRVIVLGKEKPQQPLLRMRINQLKKY